MGADRQAAAVVRSFEYFRYTFARLLVVVTFVWPFFNFNYFSPNSTVEIDFLLVFAAAVLVPALLFEDVASSLLAVAVVGIAAVWGPPGSALRLIIGIVPCLLLLALHRYFVARGEELIPRPVAYRALAFFVGFSVLQQVDFTIVPIIPGWLTNFLMVVVPRYTGLPYDEFGIRGVQGWASEPSSAAMTCFSFCVVAMRQQPEKRWRILMLFTVLAAVNRSVYGMLFLVFLVFACLWHLKSRFRAGVAVLAFALMFTYAVARTARVAEFRNYFDVYGLDVESNHELMRFAQIIYPLAAFPRIYRPVTIFGQDSQPLGLLPLLVGYGSFLGLALYYCIIFASLRFSQLLSEPLALASIVVLSFVSSPDFVPVIVAVAYGIAPAKNNAALCVNAARRNSLAPA